MRKRAAAYIISLAAMGSLAVTARADIPVIDNANLNQHSQTQSHTNHTKDTQTSTVDNTKGIDCSVHLGSKTGAAKDSVADPNKAAAERALRRYGGGPLSAGGSTQSTDGFGRDQTVQIAGQQDASTQDAKSGEQILESLAGQIGSSQTLKGSYDQNSVLAVQNGMQLNSVIRIANAWAQAINTMNLMNVAQQSGSSAVLTSPAGGHCVSGTIGQGTDLQPCRTKSCETVQLSQTPQAECVEVKYHDSYNNVVTYLLTVEDAVNFKTQGLVIN